MRIGVKSLQDFMALIVRRKWWVIAPFIALSCIVTILTKQLPKLYVSESLVLVRPRDVPENFVMDLISGTAQQRLRSIEQTVMSRSNIVAILAEFKSKLPEFTALNMDAAVEKMRSQIDLKFDVVPDSRGGTTITSFRIRYEHRSPAVAKDIASKLTTLFIEQDSRTRESHVYGTTEFLSSELQKRQLELAASDEKVKAIKSAHHTELPQQWEMNQRAVERLNFEKRDNADALNRVRTQKQNVEQLLAQVDEFIPQGSASAFVSAAPNEDPKIEEYRKAKRDFEQLSLRFPKGSQIPDLQVAKLQLERAKDRLTPEELEIASKPRVSTTATDSRAPQGKVPNVIYLSLQNQLRDIQTELEIRQKDSARIDAEFRKYNDRVDNTPGVEIKLSEVVRENEDIRRQYEELNKKLTEARLSESLESKQRGDQFMVLDPANFPVQPSKPNKWAILIIGFVICLAISVGIAFTVDVARQRIWTQSEIEAFWGVPVMVDIPEIVTDADVAAAQRRKWVVSAAALGAFGVYSVCLYLFYLRTPDILQRLDSVLQKVVYR
jgi:polysaccharide biosynthesis transport protein